MSAPEALGRQSPPIKVDESTDDDKTRLGALLDKPFAWIDLTQLNPSFSVFAEWMVKLAEQRETCLQIVVPRSFLTTNLPDFNEQIASVAKARFLCDMDGDEATIYMYPMKVRVEPARG